MNSKGRQHATVVRDDDPLGFGLKSIAEPLQRLWLIQHGNPFFDEDVKEIRIRLQVPESGFGEPESYVDWLATRWDRHGCGKRSPIYLRIDGVILNSAEALTRYSSKDLEWPIASPPRNCCEADPLYAEAQLLANRFGVADANGEPGFEPIQQDISLYILAAQWPARRTPLKGKTIYEKDILVNPKTGQRFQERYERKQLGLESRGGQGGMLAIWFEWWKQHKSDKDLADIEDSIVTRYGNDSGYDLRSIKSGIEQVERLMRPQN